MSRQAYDSLTDTLTPIAGSGGSDSALPIIATEETSTAAHAYVAGQQFIYTSKLYIATQAIAIGDTITAGTNCTLSENIVSQLAAKQNIVLSSIMTIGGQTITEVEPALRALNEKSSGVTGVKGNKESTYRTGNVNLTPANIGALATNGDGKDVTVTYTTKDAAANTTEKTNTTTDQPSTVAKLTSGETLATMFGKISAMFKNIRRLWNTVGTTALNTAYGATLTAQMANLKSYNTYSTSEKWTGKYDTDGKKIYSKVFNVTSNFTSAFLLNSDLYALKSFQGILYRTISNGSYINTIPYVPFLSLPDSQNVYYSLVLTGYVKDKYWNPQIGSGFTTGMTKIEWTFEYTKTTN